MKTKTLIITLSLGLLTLGGGGAAAWWWYMNQPEQLEARAKQYLTENRGAEAAELLTRLANSGNLEAIQQLATLYAEGKLVPQDETKAAQYYLKLAEQGNKNAQQEMATRFEQGLGIQKNIAQAGQWLEILANGGDEAALRKLCALYLSGALQDATKAFQFYQAMAEKMPEAKRALADCYAAGHGVEKNTTEAAKIYEQIISPDDAVGQYKLACCFADTGNEEKAAYHMERAAALGHIEACIKEGCRLYELKNYNKALPYLITAATTGDSQSEARLSLCYKYALGTPRNAEESEKWAQAAKSHGVDPNTLPCPVPSLVKASGEIHHPTPEEIDAQLREQYKAPASGNTPLTQNLYGGVQIDLPNELYHLLKEENTKLRKVLSPHDYVQLLNQELCWWKAYKVATTNPDNYDNQLHGEVIRNYSGSLTNLGTTRGFKNLLNKILENPDDYNLFPRIKKIDSRQPGISYKETPVNITDSIVYGDDQVFSSLRKHDETSIIHTFWDTRTLEPVLRTHHFCWYLHPVRQKDNTYAMSIPSEAQVRNGENRNGNALAGLKLGVDSYLCPTKGITEKPGQLVRYQLTDEVYEDAHKKYAKSSAADSLNISFEGPYEGEGEYFTYEWPILKKIIYGGSVLSYKSCKDNTLTNINLGDLSFSKIPAQTKNNDTQSSQQEEDMDDTSSDLPISIPSQTIPRLEDMQGSFAYNYLVEQTQNQKKIRDALGFPLKMRRTKPYEQDERIILDRLTAGTGSKNTIVFETYATNDFDVGESVYVTASAHYLGVWHKGKAWLLTAPTDYPDQEISVGAGHGAIEREGKLVPLDHELKASSRSKKLLSWPFRSLLWAEDGEEPDTATLMIGASSHRPVDGISNFIGIQRVHVNFNTGKVTYHDHWEFNETKLEPVWLDKLRLLLIPETNHAYKIIRVGDIGQSDEIGSLYVTPNDGYAVVLPNGVYAGSPGCESILNYSDGLRSIGIHPLAPWRNRPADVVSALGGDADDIMQLRHATYQWASRLGYNLDAMEDEPKLSELPQVEVDLPDLIAQGAETTFTVRMKAAVRDISHLEILSNGIKLKQDLNDIKIENGIGLLPVTAKLAKGTNWFEVTAIDAYGFRGNTCRFRVIGGVQMPPPRLYMVAMGVSQYEQEELNLQYAAKDAHDICQAFKQFYVGDKEVLLLRDAEVNSPDVLKQVGDFIAQAEPQDHVIFYCAGHGVLDKELQYFYAPHSFNPEQIDATGISMQALLDTIERTPAQTRLLLLDTCHAGFLSEAEAEAMALSIGELPEGVRAIQHRGMKITQAGEKLQGKQKKRYIDELFSGINTRRGINVLTGASGTEYALESGEWKNGIFTASVIAALNGQLTSDINFDGEITLAELYHTVSAAVAKHTNGAQKPKISITENNGAQVVAHSMGHYILKKDWATVESMIQQGYRLGSYPQGDNMDWLQLARDNDAPGDIISAFIKTGTPVNIDYIINWKMDEAQKEELLKHTLEAGNRNNIDNALISAIKTPNSAIVELLLKHGANPNIKRGDEPILMRCSSEKNAELLLEYGADETALDDRGNSVATHNPEIYNIVKQKKGDNFLLKARLATNQLVHIALKLHSLRHLPVESGEKRAVKEIELLNICAPSIQTPFGETRRENLITQCMQWPINSWKARDYRVISVARNNNDIEILVTYRHGGLSTSEPAEGGYGLIKAQFDAVGRLYAWKWAPDGKTLPKNTPWYWKPSGPRPNFSSNMQEVDKQGFEQMYNFGTYDKIGNIPLPSAPDGAELEPSYAADKCLTLHEATKIAQSMVQSYIINNDVNAVSELFEDSVLNLANGNTLNRDTLASMASKNASVYHPRKVKNATFICLGNVLEIEISYEPAKNYVPSANRSLILYLSPQGKISAICDDTKGFGSFEWYRHKGHHQIPLQTAQTTGVEEDVTNWDAERIRELGVDYAEARNGKRKDEQKAIMLYIVAADKGDMKAQRWMGWRYRQGRGVLKDEAKARMYFQRAANQGDSAAAEALGIPKTPSYTPFVSINISGMSASQIRELGVDFAEGRNGRHIDEQMAIKLYIEAANRGDAKAQRWMGWRYRQGRGVLKDEAKARMYFQRAAQQGDTAAANALSM